MQQKARQLAGETSSFWQYALDEIPLSLGEKMKTSLTMPTMPGWVFKLEEKTPGYYSAIAKSDTGVEVSREGVEEAALLKQCEQSAFDMELQLKRPLSNFLFEYCKSILLRDNLDILVEFNEKAFGSWVITLGKRRIVFDGRDQFLTIQKKRLFSRWEDELYIGQEKLTFSEFNLLMTKMKD